MIAISDVPLGDPQMFPERSPKQQNEQTKITSSKEVNSPLIPITVPSKGFYIFLLIL